MYIYNSPLEPCGLKAKAILSYPVNPGRGPILNLHCFLIEFKY